MPRKKKPLPEAIPVLTADPVLAAETPGAGERAEPSTSSFSAALPLTVNNEPQCSNCVYWQSLDNEQLMGKCRRYPPHIANPGDLTRHGPFGIFTLTLPSDLCGEHPNFPKPQTNSAN